MQVQILLCFARGDLPEQLFYQLVKKERKDKNIYFPDSLDVVPYTIFVTYDLHIYIYPILLTQTFLRPYGIIII